LNSDADSSPAKDKIIVALDAPDEPAALRLVESLSGAVGLYKIGLELFTRCGPGIIERVRTAGGCCGIFLDLKFHDIPNTVLGAVRSAAALNVEMLTVHLSGGRAMLQAATAGAPSDKPLLVLGVSVLTSSDAETLRETGISASSVENQVLRLARLGAESGLGGVVASPKEIAALRGEFGGRLRIVTPGVRPAWAAGGDDQRRVMTPGEAVRAGADYLVIGRPITGQSDPRAAAARISEEIAAALSGAALP
jgi:orotidine-5'-phosphate decarboxylase